MSIPVLLLSPFDGEFVCAVVVLLSNLCVGTFQVSSVSSSVKAARRNSGGSACRVHGLWWQVALRAVFSLLFGAQVAVEWTKCGVRDVQVAVE